MFPWKGNGNPKEVIDEKPITGERDGNPLFHEEKGLSVLFVGWEGVNESES